MFGLCRQRLHGLRGFAKQKQFGARESAAADAVFIDKDEIRGGEEESARYCQIDKERNISARGFGPHS